MAEGQGAKERIAARVRWVMGLKPVRVWQHFSNNDGPLIAGGMTYRMLFAIFAAIWVGFALLGSWVAGNGRVFDSLIDTINDIVPNLIGSHGVVTKDQLLSITGTLGWTGLIAAVGLIWTAVGALDSVRQAVRAMFEVPADSLNFVFKKLRDFALAVSFGLLLLISATLSVVSTDLIGVLFTVLGLPDASTWSRLVARIVGLILALALNTVTLAALYRVLARIPIPHRTLWVGALIGGAGLSVLSLLSGLLLGGASRNPLLASFAVLLGVLIWLNLVCQVILVAAAWIAIGMRDAGIPAQRLTHEERAAKEAEQRRRAAVILAKAELKDAQEAFANTGRFRRSRAAHRIEAAEKRLTEAIAEEEAWEAENGLTSQSRGVRSGL
jgi:membrane protein